MSNLHLSVAIDLVVPCYNEEEALPETHKQLNQLLETLIKNGQISRGHIYYVDDGSRDNTWQLIENLSRSNARVIGVRLSRNFGHQSAVLAGLFSADGDAVITIDADLQDDINAIPEMISKFQEGHQIVYGVRRYRSTDTVLKRNTALLYYSLLKRLGVQIVHNHADYRLMSRRAIDAIKQYEEANLFLRGIVPLIGFKSCSVFYDRKARQAGESKYNLRKMLRLAIDGITSFSAVPLRAVATLGFIVFFGALGMSGWVLWIKMFTNDAIPGWASSVIPIYFLGGIQLLCLGVIGEYVAKSYIETKRRPRFFVSELTSNQHSRDGFSGIPDRLKQEFYGKNGIDVTDVRE